MSKPDCEWCSGSGWRSSKPRAWFDDQPGVVTTWFPCDCGAYCAECGGTGTIEVENAHEMEVWACPKCKPGHVGEIV